MIPHLNYTYNLFGMTFTKRDIVWAFFGVLLGFIVAATYLLIKVPGGYEAITNYNEEREVLRAMKEEGKIPLDVLYRQSEATKPQSRKEFLEDYKEYNQFGIDLANRILTLAQEWETPELRVFAQGALTAREAEKKKIEALIALPDEQGK